MPGEESPADRFQSARDLTFALAALSGSETSLVLPQQSAKPYRRWRYWAITGAVVLLALVVGLALLYRPAATKAERMEFAIPTQGEVSQQAISSDGTLLAYVSPGETGEYAIFVQRVGSLQALKLAGTEGASYPFFSPDDGYIGFFAAGRLKKIPVAGGNPLGLASVLSARGGSWGSKNVIIYAPDASGAMWRVDADGSNGRPLTDKIYTSADGSHRWPVFLLPDGNHFVFWSGNFNEHRNDPNTGIYESDLEAREKKHLVACRSSVGYARENLLYADDKDSLVAVDYKPGSGKGISGKPRVIAEQVGVNPSTYWAAFSVAENATLVYHLGAGAPLSQLTWVDRTGKEVEKSGSRESSPTL